jgi:hypothetical protein
MSEPSKRGMASDDKGCVIAFALVCGVIALGIMCWTAVRIWG